MTYMGSVRKMAHVVGLAIIATLVGCIEAPPTDTQERTGPPSVPSVFRGGLQFVQGYAKGYDLAKKLDRPMLVFFTAQWCTFCHQMEQDAFANEAVSNLSKRFVCILVDADLERDVCQEFDVRGYPTIQFMTSHGVPLNRLTGRQSAEHLVSQMEAAMQAAAVRAQQTGEPRVR